MIKQIRAAYYCNKKNSQYCCLSTDTLPDYLKNGDEVYFIDTAKDYYYNESTGELVEKKYNSSNIELSDIDPLMDGIASAGISEKVSRADHVHPTDTSRLAANQGAANAGNFLVVGNDGVVVPVSVPTATGVNF